jgi:hypothetical protein
MKRSPRIVRSLPLRTAMYKSEQPEWSVGDVASPLVGRYDSLASGLRFRYREPTH